MIPVIAPGNRGFLRLGDLPEAMMIINEETVPCWSSGQRSKQKASEIYVSSI